MRLFSALFGGSAEPVDKSAKIEKIIPELEVLAADANTVINMANPETREFFAVETTVPGQARLVVQQTSENKALITLAVLTLKEDDDFFQLLPRQSPNHSDQFFPEDIIEVVEEWAITQLGDFCGIEYPDEALESIVFLKGAPAVEPT